MPLKRSHLGKRKPDPLLLLVALVLVGLVGTLGYQVSVEVGGGMLPAPIATQPAFPTPIGG